MTANVKFKNEQPTLVLKIGGNDIDAPDFLRALAAYVAGLPGQVVIVHGGGKEIGRLQAQMGITPQWVDGLRVTDDATLAVVEMVLCGRVNNRLVRALNAAGVDATGLSGADRGLIRARKLHNAHGDLGRVGEVARVRGEVLLHLLAQGVTPAIAPLGLGADGENYNINADYAAAAVAKAIGASRIVFLTNVRAVLVDGAPQPDLTQQEAQRLIDAGTIFGGMIPKVQMALHAVELGVPEALITDLDGLKQGGGTIFYAPECAPPVVAPAPAAPYWAAAPA